MQNKMHESNKMCIHYIVYTPRQKDCPLMVSGMLKERWNRALHPVAESRKKTAGATPNDGPNQNETHTNLHIHILQLHKIYVKFKDVVPNFKNKDTH